MALLQSNYLPWKGYFDIINRVDVFVFHDDLQYTKQDWRNRNRIKTPAGTRWLTVPCGTNEHRTIAEVALPDNRWQRDHWRQLLANYGHTPHFGDYAPFLADVYLNRRWNNLSELNQFLVRHIAQQWLHTNTDFADTRTFALGQRRAARVIELLEQVGATEYLSGPSAKAYLDPAEFERRGIALTWMDYSGYPEYDQPYPPFEHGVTVLDLLFCTGPDAHRYMLSFGARG